MIYDHCKPAKASITQAATSTGGNATNTAISNLTNGPAVQPPSVQQSATAQGKGDATNTAATGQGNAAGQGNASGQGNNVASYSGGTTTVYVASGGTANFYSPNIYAPPTSTPSTPVVVGQQKFAVATVKRFNQIKKTVQAQQYHGAFTPINFFLDDNPTFAPAHNEYAIQLFVQGKYVLAEEEWKWAIALDPTNVLYYNNLSQARSRGPISVTPDFPQPDLSDKLPNGTLLKMGRQGQFAVLNESNAAVYDVKIADYAVAPASASGVGTPGGASTSLIVPNNVSRDGFPMVTSRTVGNFLQSFGEILPMQAVYVSSIYGTSVPIDPAVLRVMEKQVTFSRQPHGQTEALSFKFVVQKNAKGKWAWFPQI